ncbi:uncharacterized protein G2W53_000044 [Senna tora]|uniref:Uncharacterized protein n=1 Tax=Senna tora TaxID=362788 RepID=A0A834XEY9_9FABA|nr:uncharacterized protein G2W53_000044 [Senna tora]
MAIAVPIVVGHNAHETEHLPLMQVLWSILELKS